jgi:hypothetical protein
MLFEVWQDADGCGQMAGVVHPQNDKVRILSSPDARLVQTFRAYSDRDFWRQFYHWDGRGEWEPDLGLPEHFFTEAEVAEQDEYLRIRNVG